MPFSYPTVSLGSYTYDVYANTSSATNYLDATITEAGAAWRAADVDTQARALVSATRWLDAAQWQGTIADAVTPQALQWPRNGTAPATDPTTLPIQVVDACIELAAMLIVDPDLRANLNAPIAKEIRAGSVEQQFFRPFDINVTTFLPTAIMSFVGQWIAGNVVAGAIPHDTHEKSELRRPFDFQHGL
jgi:hypothetical protein